MSYFPGHNYFLRAIESTTTINESTGALQNLTAIGSAADIGYTSPNAVNINEGTKIGYAAGRRPGSYAARGARTFSLEAALRIGSIEFIRDFCLKNDDTLPYVDFFYGISGQWARGMYRSRCSRASLSFQEGDAQELTASATFEGIAGASVSPVTLGYDFEEFGPALLWTDVRDFSVNSIPFRDKVTSLSVDVDHQLERKGIRPDFGDDVPGSRTSYDLLPHHFAVSGQLQLHDLMTNESALFTGSQRAMDWSDITIRCNDVALDEIYDVTIVNPRPTGRNQDAVESEAQMSFTVPFVADNLIISTSR